MSAIFFCCLAVLLFGCLAVRLFGCLAGGIDIGGGLTGNKDTDRVAEIIKNSKTDIIVEVKP
ncbi:hypothetical protein ACEI25_004307 [Photobacterium damselae]